MNKILITGASSGFGYAAAQHFVAQGWKVFAGVGDVKSFPDKKSANLEVIELDVTNQKSIDNALSSIDTLDVLVNNAGIGILGALESLSSFQILEIFKVNTLGTIAVTKSAIPLLRRNGSGTIINVSSSVTLKSIPFLSVYTASKAAIDAFTNVLTHKLGPLGIRAAIVSPGSAPSTTFSSSAKVRNENPFPPPYDEIAKIVFNQKGSNLTTHIDDVVDKIWEVANNQNSDFFLPAGKDAEELARNFESPLRRAENTSE